MKQNFINSIKDGAMESQRKYNILASLTISQAIVESGWGRESIGNNIFGIKVGSNWKGKKQLVDTREFVNGEWINIKAWFRDYDSIADCIEDRNKFLQYPRYKKVLTSKNYKEACIEISKSGYATDPNYTKMLIDIIEQNKLYEFDKEVVEVSNLLRRGSRGNQVKDLQSKLNNLGINAGNPDGIFGAGTEKAVRELQSIFNLGSDGIAGKNTFDLLDKLDQVKHFKLDEFRCKHCKKLKLDINLLLKLEELRAKTGPLIINSGYRCPVHNRNVGGASASQHLKGTAADIRGTKMNPSQVHGHANKIFSDGGVGKYNTFTHVDVRSGRSRWNG